MQITISQYQVSQPVAVGASSIVTVTPASGATAIVEYTNSSAADIGNGVAVWKPWAKGVVSAAAKDYCSDSVYVRVTAQGGSVSLDVNSAPSAGDIAALTADWGIGGGVQFSYDASGNVDGIVGPGGVVIQRVTAPKAMNVRQVMATPPTTTLLTTRTIASYRSYQAGIYLGTSTVLSGSSITYTKCGGIKSLGTGSINGIFAKGASVNTGTGGQVYNAIQASIMHSGTEIEFRLLGAGQQVLVKVDDRYISLTPTTVTNDGNFYYYYLNFGTYSTRRIDVLMSAGGAFGGFFTAQTGSIAPAPLRGPRTVIIGDSFTEGANASSSITGYASLFADYMGWDDVWISGVGGTGYLAAPAGKLKYRDRVATDIAPYGFQVIILTGGCNDGSTPADQVKAEAELLIQAIRAAAPTALIIQCAPFSSTGGASGMTANFIAIRDGLKAIATKYGSMWIDLIERPLPSFLTPITSTMAASAAAGATTVSLADPVAPESTHAFPDGTRFQVKAVSGSGPYTITTDGPIQTAQASGTPTRQVGDSLWSGRGKVGATTGYGNCDVIVSADGVHPSPDGHIALAQALANEVIALLATS